MWDKYYKSNEKDRKEILKHILNRDVILLKGLELLKFKLLGRNDNIDEVED